MLDVRDLCKNFGGLRVSRDISMHLERGERRVVLGPNGAGKTTLFNLLAGTLKPTSGEILLDGTRITNLNVEQRARLGLSRSYQKNNLFEGLTVRENLALAAATGEGKTSSFFSRAHESRSVRETVEEVAEMVGLADRLDTGVAHASYGNRRQLEVGLALATKPKLLLMDEPTSGVGPGMIDAFHRLIASLPREITIVIVEHDLDLGFDVADRISVLNYGEVVFEGTPDETKGSDVVREIYLGDWQGDA